MSKGARVGAGHDQFGLSFVFLPLLLPTRFFSLLFTLPDRQIDGITLKSEI